MGPYVTIVKHKPKDPTNDGPIEITYVLIKGSCRGPNDDSNETKDHYTESLRGPSRGPVYVSVKMKKGYAHHTFGAHDGAP